MSITRTFEIDKLTPEELADAFCEMWAEEQASFFAAVWRRAKAWPGAGWCQQSCSILQSAANHSERDTFEMIRTLASHLPADDVAWIATASADA